MTSTHPNTRFAPEPCPEPPERLFHASPAALNPGDRLLPGIQIGTSRGRWVWMDSVAVHDLWAMGGHVYEVKPEGPVQTCRGYWRAASAIIVAEVPR